MQEDVECQFLNLRKKSKKYKDGISCPHCYNKLTQLQKDRFAMRQKQILIAKQLNKPHIYQKEF